MTPPDETLTGALPYGQRSPAPESPDSVAQARQRMTQAVDALVRALRDLGDATTAASVAAVAFAEAWARVPRAGGRLYQDVEDDLPASPESAS